MRKTAITITMISIFSWLGVSGAQAQINLNPEFGSALYAPFTVFSPDADKPENYADEILLVFHGMMSAVPNGTYKRLRKRLRKHMTVIGINYHPFKAEETKQFLDRVAEIHCRGKKVTVLGTSFGSFWARYFAAKIKAHRLVMINPIIDVQSRIKLWVGTERFNTRRNENVTISASSFQGYDSIPTRYEDHPKSLVVLAADDKIGTPRATKQYFSGAPNVEIAWYESGGHTINLKKHPALDRIVLFLAPR